MPRMRHPENRFIAKPWAVVDTLVWRAALPRFSLCWPHPPEINTRDYLRELKSLYDRKEHYTHPKTFYQSPSLPVVQERLLETLDDGREVFDLRFSCHYEPHASAFVADLPRYKENELFRGRWYRSDPLRPTIVCLHGMGAGAFAYEEREFEVRRWLALGLDVILTQLPYHGDRRPADAPLGTVLFPSPDLVRTNEAARQAVQEMRMLLKLLRLRGAPLVGLFGRSLGAYVSALLACLEPGLDFVWLLVPAVSLSEIMWRRCAPSEARTIAQRAGVTENLLGRVFAVHSPFERQLLVPVERVAFILGAGDRIALPSEALKLWEHFGRPELRWFPGSHVVHYGRDVAHAAIERHWESCKKNADRRASASPAAAGR